MEARLIPWPSAVIDNNPAVKYSVFRLFGRCNQSASCNWTLETMEDMLALQSGMVYSIEEILNQFEETYNEILKNQKSTTIYSSGA